MEAQALIATTSWNPATRAWFPHPTEMAPPQPRSRGRRVEVLLRAWIGVFALLWGGTALRAADHVDGFEGDEPTWQVRFDKTGARLLSHRRHSKVFQGGATSENIELESFSEGHEARLELPLPPSRLIEETAAALWVKSNRDGIQIAVRVVFPFQKVPGQEGYLRVVVEGDSYTATGGWQELRCDQIDANLKKKLPQLRHSLLGDNPDARDLDTRGLYVESVLLKCRAGRGTVEYFLDDLTFGPLVPLGGGGTVRQASNEQVQSRRELELHLDRLVFQGRPFFPRMVPTHGEDPAALAALRLNLAWVPDPGDTAFLESLRKVGLRAVATPPRPRGADGQALPSGEGSLAPFTAEADPIAMWILGSKLSPKDYEIALDWSRQVHNADRRLSRPVTADVGGRERSFSRDLNPLGISRSVVHSFGFKEYRDWLVQRRNLAQPGTFLWTTIQTENPTPNPGAVAVPVVVEPEQIRLQVYAAIAAGYRGLCYWTETSLDDRNPITRERRLQIALLNMEIELLEPWLATGSLGGQTKFTAKIPDSGNFKQLNTDFGAGLKSEERRRELLDEREDSFYRKHLMDKELEAASFRTDYGQLLIPVWYGDKAQFVPDQMAANDAEIIVPGAAQSAAVYEISTTEIRAITPPRKQWTAGGLKITLDKLDMTAAVVLVEDRALVDRLRAKMEGLRETAAEATLELAELKLARVAGVDARLHAMDLGQVDSARLLASARLCATRSREAIGRRQFHDARLLANNCMQLCRILQRAYWNDAAREFKRPVVASPYLVSFQTLPEHWEFIRRLGRTGSTGRSVMPAGDFESFDELTEGGLQHRRAKLEGFDIDAEYHKRGRSGGHCLRLVAMPQRGQETPLVMPETPVSITTPGARVEPGQVVYVSFWVKIPNKIVGSLDGVLLHDSIGGRERALRLPGSIPNWLQFQFLREVREATDLTLTCELTGLGEVLLDDVEVIAFDPPAIREGSLAEGLDEPDRVVPVRGEGRERE
jgi:hypothetical protein